MKLLHNVIQIRQSCRDTFIFHIDNILRILSFLRTLTLYSSWSVKQFIEFADIYTFPPEIMRKNFKGCMLWNGCINAVHALIAQYFSPEDRQVSHPHNWFQIGLLSWEAVYFALSETRYTSTFMLFCHSNAAVIRSQLLHQQSGHFQTLHGNKRTMLCISISTRSTLSSFWMLWQVELVWVYHGLFSE